MLARDEIVQALQAALPPAVDVIGYARSIDAPSRPTVMVRVDTLKPSPHAGGLWLLDAALVLIAAQTTPGPADDELESLLQDVLYALIKVEDLSWSEAKRAVYGPDPANPTNPAFEVAVSTHIIKEQQ